MAAAAFLPTVLDRTAVIGFVVAGGIVVASLGYAAGYASGRAAGTTPAGVRAGVPNGTTVNCSWGDFPYYPGSLAVAASNPGGYAHHVYVPASAVAAFYANGASQMAWSFTLTSRSPTSWTFRLSRPPSCTGSLSVVSDPAGGTLFEADPDSP